MKIIKIKGIEYVFDKIAHNGHIVVTSEDYKHVFIGYTQKEIKEILADR